MAEQKEEKIFTKIVDSSFCFYSVLFYFKHKFIRKVTSQILDSTNWFKRCHEINSTCACKFISADSDLVWHQISDGMQLERCRVRTVHLKAILAQILDGNFNVFIQAGNIE